MEKDEVKRLRDELYQKSLQITFAKNDEEKKMFKSEKASLLCQYKKLIVEKVSSEHQMGKKR